MTPFTEEAALKHLEENWSDVQSDIGVKLIFSKSNQKASTVERFQVLISGKQIPTLTVKVKVKVFINV